MKTCLLVTTTFWPLKHMSPCRVKESQTYLYMILLIQNPKQTKLTRAVQSQGSSYTSRGKDWKGTQRGLLGNWQCSAFKNTVLMTRESYSVCRNSLSYVLVSAYRLPSSEELKKKKIPCLSKIFCFSPLVLLLQAGKKSVSMVRWILQKKAFRFTPLFDRDADHG